MKGKFDYLFEKYYSGLVVYTHQIIHDLDESSDIVQSIYIELWDKYQYENEKEARNFLFLSARNRALNYLRHLKIKDQFIEHQLGQIEQEYSIEDYSLYVEDDLRQIIEYHVSSMPSQMQSVFRLKFFEELSSKEIGVKMNIAPRTVEKHYERSLKFLKSRLYFLKKITLLFTV